MATQVKFPFHCDDRLLRLLERDLSEEWSADELCEAKVLLEDAFNVASDCRDELFVALLCKIPDPRERDMDSGESSQRMNAIAAVADVADMKAITSPLDSK